MPMSRPGPSKYIPSARARSLAAALRGYRERALLTQADVSARLGWTPSRIGHIETARRPVNVPDVLRLIDLYGVTGPEADNVLAVTRDATRRGWWTDYSSVLNGPYVPLEDAAAEICEWSLGVIPGLLQTVETAREVIKAGQFLHATDAVLSAERLEKRVDARLLRQKILSREDAPHLHVILNQPVLEHPIGSPQAWRHQLHRLVEDGRRPNVTIQVLPTTVGMNPGLEGSFTVLRYADPSEPDIGYCEGRFDCVVMESPMKVAECNLTFGWLRDAALSPRESADLIDRIAAK